MVKVKNVGKSETRASGVVGSLVVVSSFSGKMSWVLGPWRCHCLSMVTLLGDTTSPSFFWVLLRVQLPSRNLRPKLHVSLLKACPDVFGKVKWFGESFQHVASLLCATRVRTIKGEHAGVRRAFDGMAYRTIHGLDHRVSAHCELWKAGSVSEAWCARTEWSCQRSASQFHGPNFRKHFGLMRVVPVDCRSAARVLLGSTLPAMMWWQTLVSACSRRWSSRPTTGCSKARSNKSSPSFPTKRLSATASTHTSTRAGGCASSRQCAPGAPSLEELVKALTF